ncbi:MAG TPA: 2Fe-2S iron-sulfur cluster-binding protein [Pirellulales bacterium]|nr:2Fe-2S iron-sulfur cluster-binding protein [Pirellulales bacterium]
MAKVIVDGQPVEIGDKERLNGIQAAKRANIDIPHYCWHAGLTVVASCRMCLVETGTVDAQTGKITMQPKLSPACQTPAKDGTVFVTNSDKVKQAHAQVEEGLLLRHPVDCPICDKAGECHLQDYHFEHGQKERRADIRPFTSRRRDVGDTVTLFVDRCVMCTRCVRFTREIAGTSELMVANRGSHEEIDVFPGYPLANKLSGNVVDLCPVGALGDKDFLYQQRVWFMKRHAGVCAGCSTGCSIWVEENQDHVYRLKPRENPQVNGWWMCDEGRYGFHYIHSEQRQTGLRQREGEDHVPLDWAMLANELRDGLSSAGRLGAVLSPHLTVEEAYLLVKYVRQLDPDAVLAMGPVPTLGGDERFKSGFTIRAEKCPNHRGVEAVIRHFAGGCTSFDEFLIQCESGAIGGAWITGGYPQPAFDEAAARRLKSVKTLVVQDLWATPVWQQATFQVPGATFAEKDGSYVNHADRLQSFKWSIRPPAGAWAEGQLYWRLLGRHGLYSARKALDELAAEITYFEVASGQIPDTGIDLKLNQLAS